MKFSQIPYGYYFTVGMPPVLFIKSGAIQGTVFGGEKRRRFEQDDEVTAADKPAGKPQGVPIPFVTTTTVAGDEEEVTIPTMNNDASVAGTSSEHVKKKKGAGFFHIDRRTWSVVCDLMDIDAAIAYIVLASGTGEGNDVTKWSVKSLRTYAGMRRELGKAAIERLKVAGLLGNGPESTRDKPRFYLVPWEETKLCQPQRKKTSTFRAELMPSEQADLIWLPNSIVRNPASDGPAPMQMLRMANDIWLVRLFVDLYHGHSLESDGGVRTSFLRYKYERAKVGEQGPYTIWRFKGEHASVTWKGPAEPHRDRPTPKEGNHPIFGTLDRLMQMGLCSWIPHVFPNDRMDCEPIHSVGHQAQKAEPEEQAIRDAAYYAASAMLQPYQAAAVEAQGHYLMLPLPTYLDQVELRGVLRMRFRPQTSATGKWYQELLSKGPDWVARYKELRAIGHSATPAIREWKFYGF